jgi:hypothetical protein
MKADVTLRKRYLPVLYCILAACGGFCTVPAQAHQGFPANTSVAWDQPEDSESAAIATAMDDGLGATAADSISAGKSVRALLATGGELELDGAIQMDYTLSLDSIWVELGENIAFNIELENAWPLQGFDLLIYYDPSAFWTAGVTPSGTRAADFEYFDYQYDEGGAPGHLRIRGLRSYNTANPSFLQPGSGPIARLLLRVVDDADFAGIWIPFRFLLSGGVGGPENTLTDVSGATVERAQIEFKDGWVIIAPLGPTILGDINLNGVGIEISDYVYFTNYFMDPYHYPLNAQQRAASDLNQDHIPATIADLVTLINMIVRGQHYQATVGGAPISAKVQAIRTDEAVEFSYDSDFDLGGVLVVLRSDDDALLDGIQLTDNRMSYVAARDGEDLRIFLYSLDGEVLRAGQRRFMRISGMDEFDLVSVDGSSADGRTAAISFSTGGSMLPDGFDLQQNYPNPFNPDTRIGFSLRTASWVTLEVIDLLGRKVQVLADGDFSAGEHEVTWDGRNRRGELVASGVYFYRIQVDGRSLTRKMMLMK